MWGHLNKAAAGKQASQHWMLTTVDVDLKLSYPYTEDSVNHKLRLSVNHLNPQECTSHTLCASCPQHASVTASALTPQ